MIEIKDVCKSFGDHVVIDHFSETFQDGEFVILSGPSGCGKTTLLHMIGGIEPPDCGIILYNGSNISVRHNLMEFLRFHAAFLFQNFALVDKKTVLKNLEMIPEKSRSGVTASEALERVGLSGFEKKTVYTLSGGEQQRVALARIMMKKCDVILADEPTGSLDSKNADMVMQILKDMSKEGKTVIVVTHAEQYLKIADRVCSLV